MCSHECFTTLKVWEALTDYHPWQKSSHGKVPRFPHTQLQRKSCQMCVLESGQMCSQSVLLRSKYEKPWQNSTPDRKQPMERYSTSHTQPLRKSCPMHVFKRGQMRSHMFYFTFKVWKPQQTTTTNMKLPSWKGIYPPPFLSTVPTKV